MAYQSLLSMKEKSQLGAAAETLESIKYNAPRYYSAQYRAVTAQDYALIAKKVYSNADSVVAYGGDSLKSPNLRKSLYCNSNQDWFFT